MKFLFFDIECSNGYNICSFGYVLTDTDFRILEKKDIIINPESKFILSSKGSRPKIQLAYSEEFFYKQNPFDFYYNDIKSLLTNKNYIVFGHSINSDFNFLNIACKRYNLPIIEAFGYDTQKMHLKLYKAPHALSLENIIDDLEIEHNLTFHKSCDDANGTMLVLKHIFQEESLTIEKLKSDFDDCLVKNQIQPEKIKRESFNDKVDKLRAKYSNMKFKAKVAFADGFKKLPEKEQLKVIEKLFMNGYDYTSKIFYCDLFIKDNVAGNRNGYFKYLTSKGKKIDSMTSEKFMSSLL